MTPERCINPAPILRALKPVWTDADTQVDMGLETRSEIEAELERLEEEERTISAKRRRLHDRMDIFAGAAGAEGAAVQDRRAEEQALSARRRELHQQIRALRARRDEAD